MNRFKKALLLNNAVLVISLITAGSARAMEEMVTAPQERTFIMELAKAVQAKDFDRYFALLDEKPIEMQKRLCEAILGFIDKKKAIHLAAEQGNAEAVKKLLARGATIECRDICGNTPLLFSASRSFNTMLVLLEKGADTAARNQNGETVIHWAAWGGNVPAIIHLIQHHGLDVNSPAHSNVIPLHCAARAGHLDAVNALIANGAQKESVVTGSQETALHIAARRESVATIVALIKDHGFNPNAKTTSGCTPLHLAVNSAPIEVIETLIKLGAHIDSRDSRGIGIFERAINNTLASKNTRASTIAKLIVDYGLDPNQAVDRTAEYDTPLGLALSKHYCLIAFTLQCAGSQLSEREKSLHRYRTPCLATLTSTLDKQTLLTALAQESLAPWDPNVVDSEQSTPLIKAVKNNCLDCTLLLLEDKRTNPNIQDIFGRTALHYVMQNAGFCYARNICSHLLNLQRTNVALKDAFNKKAREVQQIGLTSRECLAEFYQEFDLRKMKVQLYLSLKNARCSEQCEEQECSHAIRLPADICMKIARLLTKNSLPVTPIQYEQEPKVEEISPPPATTHDAGIVSQLYSMFQALFGSRQ